MANMFPVKLKKNWFLVGLVLMIMFAKLAPDIGAKEGILMPEITVKIIAVSVIFFISGLCLKSGDFTKTFFQWHLHCFVQGFTFIYVPYFLWLLSFCLQFFFSDWIVKGFITVGCMPPPVSSAVILTKAVGGNEAAAIFNSAFGSFLGIIITPMELLYYLGLSTSIPVSSTVVQLFFTVVLPLCVGQITRLYVHDVIEKSNIPFQSIGSVLLLLIIYTTFCDTFLEENLDLQMTTLCGLVFTVVSIQVFMLWTTFYLTTRFRGKMFTPADTVAIMYCATHKSLTLGIPMLKILFSGHPSLIQLSIPLLMYHPIQILLGGLLVPYLQTWMQQTHSWHRWGLAAV